MNMRADPLFNRCGKDLENDLGTQHTTILLSYCGQTKSPVKTYLSHTIAALYTAKKNFFNFPLQLLWLFLRISNNFSVAILHLIL